MAEIRVGRGVVHENIQPAKFLFDKGKGLFNLCHIANMAGQCFGAATGTNDGIGNQLTAINFAAGDNHMSALFGE